MGVYNTLNGKPNTVNFDAGTVSCTAGNAVYAITINQTLTAGWYWLAFNSQTAATTNAYVSLSSYSYTPFGMTPFSADLGSVQFSYTENSVTGAFATANATTSGTITDTPAVALRKA